MSDKSASVSSFDSHESLARQIRQVRSEQSAHAAQDLAEFTAIRKETADALDAVRLQVSDLGHSQTSIARNQETILHALGLSAAHDHSPKRKRRRPVAMMGQWEGLLKLGGAFTGLMMMLKMIEAAWPSITSGVLALWHAILAMNHVAVG